MRAVILGSGATFGTIVDCPTLRGFGAALVAQRWNWRAEYPILAQAVADLWPDEHPAVDDWNLGNLWTRLDYYAKLHPVLGTGDYGGQASCELHKAGLDVYGRFVLDRAAQLFDQGKPFTLRNILEQLHLGDVLVSFNWDTLAEYLLGQLGRPVVQAPHPPEQNAIQLVKPHGSVSWLHLLGKNVEFSLPDGRPRIDPMRPEDVVVGTAEPLLLGAVPIKSELIKEVQAAGGSNAYQVVVSQWRAVVEAVRHADQIVVVGYSFPADDGYGRFLFREAVAHRGDRRIKAVEFYETQDRGEQLQAVLQQIFNPQHGPTRLGEVEDP